MIRLGRGLSAFVFAASFVGLPQADAGQIITGTLTAGKVPADVQIKTGDPIPGIHVDFFDARNAEPLGSSTTGSNGVYNSGTIPAGDYRILFEEASGSGYTIPWSFYQNQTEFCSATTVSLPLGGSAVASQTLSILGPVSVLPPFSNGAHGTVVDSSTGSPLPGIEVRILDAFNGIEIASTTTNSDGTYEFSFQSYNFEVRFVDATGAYFPTFATASANADEFCSGVVFTAPTPKFGLTVDRSLDRVPANVLTQTLVNQIANAGLPNNVSSPLIASLVQAINLLTDGNSANNVAVCGQLKSFISRVDIEQRRELLTDSQADSFKSQANLILTKLGC